ncbi:tyrosine-protein phosphatase [Xylocopilactobacillus apis]|uniref:Protein-tyrosine-phosphatase n=1 Tax=Xylocopilactobacillus apis TaxID=2932183 RepID=A0AAU9DLY9_9LACO|nr:tyrosine-protein phosphatase [Xylocopilactobacillus apis]BDR55868.1 protein-tyrosine-phosphatase [Xylocopilactobacillus apis]
MENRILNFSGSVNLREMGGYPTQDGKTILWHKLLRSGALSNLDKKGQSELVDYGVKYDLDFRSPTELKISPDPNLSGVKYEHLPVYSPDSSSISSWRSFTNLIKHHHKFTPASDIGGIYQNVVLNEYSQNTYSKMFHLMLENSEPNQSLLFHCSAGQDRTGIGAALIEKLFNVPDQIIIEDYLLSNMAYTSRTSEVLTNDDVDEFINQMNLSDVQANNITVIFKAIDYFYGSFKQYAKDALKLSESEITDLRKIYLKY